MSNFLHERSISRPLGRDERMGDLGSEVANALYWELAIPRHRVTAEVDGGVIILHGVVELAYQKSCAEATVRRVSERNCCPRFAGAGIADLYA
jgi:osmotically-inducible protein OsmY